MPRCIDTCFRFYTQMRVEKKHKTFAYKIYSHFTQQCNCFHVLDLENLQEQVSKSILVLNFDCLNKCDRNNFVNSRPLASNFKTFSRSLEQFFLTVVQNNFENKIPFLYMGLRFSVASFGLKRTIL